VPRVNGWSIARQNRDRTPDRTQRLLNHASWDTSAAMSVVRRFAAKGLGQAARRRSGIVIGAIDETGQEKAGEATAGVKRQYLGCAGKVAASASTSAGPGSTPPSPATPCWSWPALAICAVTAAQLKDRTGTRHRPRSGPTSRHPPSPA
jgi:hypothetical protein